MEVIYPRCCGLDVHRREVVAYMVRTEPDGTVLKEMRAFGAITPDILVLADWLAAHEVSHVAMESTGVYRSTATGSPRTGRAVPPPHLRRRQPQLARGRIQGWGEDRLLPQLQVPHDGRAHGDPIPLPQPGRAFDVGEEKRDGAAGQVSHDLPLRYTVAG